VVAPRRSRLAGMGKWEGSASPADPLVASDQSPPHREAADWESPELTEVHPGGLQVRQELRRPVGRKVPACFIQSALSGSASRLILDTLMAVPPALTAPSHSP